MTSDDIADRLDAPDRALNDDETNQAEFRSGGPPPEDVRRLERRVSDLETTVEELEAAVQAVRGYAGNIRAVNRDVERRASAALAKVEALESSIGTGTAGATREARVHGDDPSRGQNDPSRGQNEKLTREPTLIAESGDDETGGGRSTGGGSGQRTAVSDPESDEYGVRPSEHTDPGEKIDGGDGQDDTEQFIERVRDAI